MFKVLGCVTNAHDLRLVLLAAAVCAFTTFLTAYLYARLPTSSARRVRLTWLGVVGLVAGSGVWAVHFVAMLAFEPGLREGFEPLITLASLLISIAFSTCAFWVATPAEDGSRRVAAGGALLGIGVALMHFTGMAALRIQAQMAWNLGYVAAAVAISVLFATASLRVGKPGVRGKALAASAGLLLLAICGLHFTAMAALDLTPTPLGPVPHEVLSRPVLAVAVAGLTTLVIAVAVILVVSDLRLRRRSFDTMTDAVDTMADAMVIFDKDDRLVVWNAPYAVQLAPVAAQLRIGMSYAELMAMVTANTHNLDEAGKAALVAKLVADRQASDSDVEHKTPDGRWYRRRDRRTSSGGIVTVFTDITDLKRNAEILAKALEEADAASRAKTEFLANMTHEIRTPLNGVLGMAEVMAQSELQPLQRRRLAVIRQSGEDLLAIVNDILDVSRIEAGKLDILRGEIDAADLAAGVEAAFGAQARANAQLRFSVAVQPEVVGPRRGDPERVSQVLHILVSNALKFTTSGEIRIAITDLDPRRGDGLRLTVSDTGVGIAAEMLPRLFEKFTQADGSNTRRYGGAGLGLTIARSLVQLMSGEITADSIEGEGSTFTVTLPAARIADTERAMTAA